MRNSFFKIFALICILSFIFSNVNNVLAALPAAPAPVVYLIDEHTYAYQNVLESGDMLILAPYHNENWWLDDDADGENDLEIYDVFVEVTDATYTIYGDLLKYPPRMATTSEGEGCAGIMGFYVSAASMSSYGITFGVDGPVVLRFRSNPSSFSTYEQSTFTIQGGMWRTSASLADTSDYLTSDLPNMVSALSKYYPEDQLITDNKINVTGAVLTTEAFSWILQVAPSAFTLGETVVGSDFDPDANLLQQDLDAITSAPKTAIEGFSEGYGFDANIISVLIVTALTFPLVFVLKRVSQDTVLSFVPAATVFVWWTSMGLIPSPLIFTIATIATLSIATWIWRMIPTN